MSRFATSKKVFPFYKTRRKRFWSKFAEFFNSNGKKIWRTELFFPGLSETDQDEKFRSDRNCKNIFSSTRSGPRLKSGRSGKMSPAKTKILIFLISKDLKVLFFPRRQKSLDVFFFQDSVKRRFFCRIKFIDLFVIQDIGGEGV